MHPLILSTHTLLFILWILMERQRTQHFSSFVWFLIAFLLSQNLVLPVTSTGLGEQKNYYPIPDPHIGTPPSGSHHNGTPSHGGGYHPTPTPSTPSGGNCGTPPQDPTTPSHPPSHGGYYHSPPTSPPTYGGSPPTTPIDPGTPPTPFLPAPTPPTGGTCDFWRSHPTLIWGVLGWWGTLGNVFGVTSLPGVGSTMTLPQALANTRTDGLGALYREGTASFLNSMVNHKFPFTTKQVRESFVRALGANSAAAAQAHVFKLANEGHLKNRA